MKVPSRQEMFDRAWEGLESQGWKHATRGSTKQCTYLNRSGHRCAWGWIDTELDGSEEGTVVDLKKERIGLAAHLRMEDVQWALELQYAHDDSASAGTDLRVAMTNFALMRGLTVPVPP